MSSTLSLTESQTLAALRTVLLAMIPGVEIIRAQINRVPEPQGDNFILMTPIGRERLSTTVEDYADGFLLNPKQPSVTIALQPTQVTVQIDVHGPSGADTAQILSTLLRSRVACAAFTATGFDVQPLYTSEPHEAPFLNAEDQIEYRWSLDAVLQSNPTVTTPQEFADVLEVGLINVDARFPPA